MAGGSGITIIRMIISTAAASTMSELRVSTGMMPCTPEGGFPPRPGISAAIVARPYATVRACG